MIPSGSGRIMKIKMEETERKCTRKFVCNEYNQEKYTRCIEAFIVEKLQCKPSWFKILDNNMVMSLCRGSEKYQKYLELIKDLSKANCNVPNCKENIWKTQEIWTKPTSNWAANTTFITYESLSKTVKVSEEVFTYTVFDMLNDFAGVLSLFLGVSIISLYDYIIETSRKICTTIKK